MLKTISDFDSIGGKIRYFRKAKNLLQEDLATMINLDVSTIKRLENNKATPSFETCKKISTALNMPIDFIYDDYLSFVHSDYPKFFKNIRKQLNLTQAQLADVLGLNRKTISRWEKKINFPSLEHYKVLCEYITKNNI